MRWMALLLCAAAFLAAAPPRRVVSQAVGTDDLLMAVAEPSQIAALSHLGHDPRYAPSVAKAKRFPALRNSTAEEILRFRPDLVVTTGYAPPESLVLLRRTGVKVHVIQRFERLDEVLGSLRELGRLLGREAAADAVVKATETRVATLRQRLEGVKPVRVMSAGIYPFVSGADTSFQDICDHAGAVNAAAEAGLRGIVPMPGEQPLTWRVSVLIGPSEPGKDLAPQLKNLSPYRFLPALKQGRVVTVPGALLAATSHRRVEAYEWVARALHPERFP